MTVYALDVLQLATRGVTDIVEVKGCSRVVLEGGGGVIARLLQHNPHTIACLARLLVAESTHTLGDLARLVDAHQLFEPSAGVLWLVDITPGAKLCRGRRVDLLIKCSAAVILDGILDGGDGEDKGKWKSGNGTRRGAKDGEHCK